MLENFLLDFPGCLVVVSHDRYFMDKIVDHLFIFRGDGSIEDFPGNYTDYRVYENSQSMEEKTIENKTKTTWKNPKSGNKLSYNEQKEFKRLEKEIENLEGEKINLETQFTDPNLSQKNYRTFH